MNVQSKTLGNPLAQPAAPQILRASRIWEGRPYPLGATWDGLGVNFALFSANATRVELCVFDQDGKRVIKRIELPEITRHGSCNRRCAMSPRQSLKRMKRS